EAVAARLRPQTAEPPPIPPPVSRTVADAIRGFLAAVAKKVDRGKVKAKTAADYRLTLNPFEGMFGPRQLADLVTEAGREEVEEWADRAEWSPSTRNTYLGTVQTLFKWAGLRLAVRRPPKESRGADTCLTDDQFEVVIRVAVKGRFPGDLREL